MRTGLREAEIWKEKTWVTVRATKEENKYRIEPDEGEKFTVAALTEEDLDFEITKALRKQFPDR